MASRPGRSTLAFGCRPHRQSDCLLLLSTPAATAELARFDQVLSHSNDEQPAVLDAADAVAESWLLTPCYLCVSCLQGSGSHEREH